MIGLIDREVQSSKLMPQLRLLAKRYPQTKFLSIPGSRCIEGYPDRLQPTLILYRGGEVVSQVVSWGKDRPREDSELEALLLVSKVVFASEKAESETIAPPDASESEDEKPKSSAKRNIQRKASKDEDSDFDL